ncbi:hypothetical protein FRACYDRAFT_235317 [Fragilariopsis cylindrus CCMP1102]|uniref:Uncharacterized protein n=1 Tax=Fragilariopsis cylindrus CCMP1102 TaxID=635003 RepID=A0A1E7FM98_9STRA|nr:hypothetical protein FRACYDRAFT_235317 [Fragilariopsis cylindrus CCMP1102]|eukprot:OEU19267.1 hypothetical protein FRACYDRAFT_235317 [Fragilariopsis cylindrus CCMP1102]
MGKEAAKMMTAFGDGPYPDPSVLEQALLGTRKALQVSIMDARKVRRRLQQEFQDARNIVLNYNPKKNGTRPNPTMEAAVAWKRAAAAAAVAETNKKASSNNNNNNSNNEHKNETDAAPMTPSNNKSETKIKTETTKPNKQQQPQYHSGSIDPKLLYRAMSEGTDKLSYAHKCGFHMEELTHLYPEEMRAYERWNEMHEEYNTSKSDDKEKAAEVCVGEEDDVDADADGSAANPSTAAATVKEEQEEKETNTDKEEPDGGHLRQRAAQFDFRTDGMKSDWYIEYAKVRQGSFLPNNLRVRRTPAEIEWDRLRKMKKGRQFAGAWECMSGRAPWAFLAYDRFGRNVEKAIFLRNDEANDRDFSNRSLWDLPKGEQLTLEDIERALQDPDIKPATVYGTEDSTGPSSIQLYFGPGWEDRLELEMDEMIASAKGTDHQISEEERMVRNHEMELLVRISAPPVNGNALEELVKSRKQGMSQNDTANVTTQVKCSLLCSRDGAV